MRIFLIFGVISFVHTLPLDSEWINFKAKYLKVYEDSGEEQYRKDIFNKNLQLIQSHNEKYHQGEVSFNLKINKFGDLTNDEFKSVIGSLKAKQEEENHWWQFFQFFAQRNAAALPDSVDWKEKGAVTEVKDQGYCGSSWAFSTTGAMEGQMFLKKGKLTPMSEQNLIDCSNSYGNQGCGGGLMSQAFDYIIDNSGINSEESYPYEAQVKECRFNQNNIVGVSTGYFNLPKEDESYLQSILAEIGPLSAGIDAGLYTFQFYSSGIYDDLNCSTEPNHGVLLTGYGIDNEKKYWSVKNSWGTDWGEKGYVRLARLYYNQCGIANSASYPVVV